MQDHFKTAIQRTLAYEGGYVNDPHDPGGETRFGISKRSYPDLDIASLTVETARQIYRRDFWRAPGFDLILDRELACKLFDLGVNTGPVRATRFLQTAAVALGAGLAIDGRLGPVTLAWVNAFRHPDALLMAVKVFAGEHYITLDQPKYLAGWLRRLAQ